MRPFLRTFCLCLALLAFLPASAQQSSPLTVKEHMLSNGMTVWINEDHSQPKVFGAVVVNAGAKDCPDTGIAHYFEHIMFKGTEEIGTVDYAAEKPWLDSISARYDQLAATKDEAQRLAIQKDINRLSQKAGEYAIPNEFNRLISQYGGTGLNAGTSWDFTFYHNFFSPQYLRQWCQLNSDRLIRPVYRLFQNELETVYEEKNMYADDMLNSAMENMFKELFGTQPYAYPVIGSTENLKNPKLSAMRDFYERYYVGCNMGIVLCGDVDADEVMPLLESTFGRIEKGTKPTHTPSPLPDITQTRTVEIKIPVPLVSIEMLAYKAPTEYERDANALSLAMSLLYNGQAGMLDSLCNEGTLLMTAAATQGLNDAGVAYILVVPNLLSSSNKAENACLQQVKRLCEGDFTDEAFITQKQEAYREANKSLETISDRAMKMVMVMSSGHSWQEYLDKVNAISSLTKADVVATAKRYFNAPYVKFKKKNGNYAKDKMSQPGYTPVVPKNRNAESDYARRLAAIPTAERQPRLIDFNKDVTITPLSPTATLYTVDNPVNDLFELTVVYNKGTKSDRRLEAASMLLNNIGTDSLSRQELAAALQSLGANVDYSAGYTSFTITVTGVDQNFEPTLRLLNHFIGHAKSNDKALDQVRDTKKAESKSLDEESDEVFMAVRAKVLFGDNSSYLNRLTKAETKKMSGEKMLKAFDEIFANACDISYSGTHTTEEVKSAVCRYLPVSRSHIPYIDYSQTTKAYDEPVVYVYDMPKSRQTIFFTHEQVPPPTTREGLVPFTMLSSYLGGGMSSVLFQEVREFRSMAYSTGSFVARRPYRLAPDAPLGIGCYVGTQADKTMSAIALVDSLLSNMPISEKNFEAAKRRLLNAIDASFPSFRGMGQTVANMRNQGFSEDSNTGLAALYTAATMDDIKRYYEAHIRSNARHRVLGIVGNKSKLDMGALARYGRVVILRDKDVFRK